VQPHFQCRTMHTGHFSSRSSWLNMHPESHSRQTRFYFDRSHMSLNTWTCKNPIRK
jgi:hypothetical protein